MSNIDPKVPYQIFVTYVPVKRSSLGKVTGIDITQKSIVELSDKNGRTSFDTQQDTLILDVLMVKTENTKLKLNTYFYDYILKPYGSHWGYIPMLEISDNKCHQEGRFFLYQHQYGTDFTGLEELQDVLKNFTLTEAQFCGGGSTIPSPIVLTKSVTPQHAKIGEEVNYKIVSMHIGDTNAVMNNYILEDTLDPKIEFIAFTKLIINGSDIPLNQVPFLSYDGGTHKISFTLPSITLLAPPASNAIQILYKGRVKTTAKIGDKLKNTVIAKADGVEEQTAFAEVIVIEIPIVPGEDINPILDEEVPPALEPKETDDGAILFTYNFITQTWSIDHTDKKTFNFLVNFNKEALMISDYGIYKMDYEKAPDGNMSYFVLPLFDGGVQKFGKLLNKITIDFIGTVKLEYEPYPKDKWNRKGYQKADVLHINPLFKVHKKREKCSFYIPLQDMHIQDNHLKHIRVYFNDTIYGIELQSENFPIEEAT